MASENEVAERHLRSCEQFGAAVAAAGGKWDRPTPCADWSARDVLEHVIGFHDVLLLRPMGAKPDRPRYHPLQRWLLTHEALRSIFSRAALFDGTDRGPGRRQQSADANRRRAPSRRTDPGRPRTHVGPRVRRRSRQPTRSRTVRPVRQPTTGRPSGTSRCRHVRSSPRGVD